MNSDNVRTNGQDRREDRLRHADIHTTENENSFAEQLIIKISFILVIIFFPIAVFFCLLTTNEFERAVIFRLGRLRKNGVRGPGLIFILPCVDQYAKVDLRTTSFDVPTQEVLTKDSVSIQLDAVVYYCIKDPLKAIIQVANARESTKLLAQTTLRNVAGTKMMIQLITEKDTVSHLIEKILDQATKPWGVSVERVEIKDVRLPLDLQRSMAAEAEALREAKAKIAAAEGELNASEALKKASDIMGENPISLQLRYLQTLSGISNNRNHCIIFPFPIDIIRQLIWGPDNPSGPPSPPNKPGSPDTNPTTEENAAQSPSTSKGIHTNIEDPSINANPTNRSEMKNTEGFSKNTVFRSVHSQTSFKSNPFYNNRDYYLRKGRYKLRTNMQSTRAKSAPECRSKEISEEYKIIDMNVKSTNSEIFVTPHSSSTTNFK